jgi:hypothetical protein
MVERIIELAKILENKHYVSTNNDIIQARKEIETIIIPKVIRINELLIKADLKMKRFRIDGFNGNIRVEYDTDWNGKIISDRRSIILEIYDNVFDDYSYTYVNLDYFDKSDEELFEIFKEQSINMKKSMLNLHIEEKLKSEKLINEINKQIEEIKNLKL